MISVTYTKYRYTKLVDRGSARHFTIQLVKPVELVIITLKQLLSKDAKSEAVIFVGINVTKSSQGSRELCGGVVL